MLGSRYTSSCGDGISYSAVASMFDHVLCAAPDSMGGASYSCAAQVQRGVLPGCPVAMFLLQMVMMLPFDICPAVFRE
eukprot:3020105-Pyramimonas_sp.AAC.1